MENVQYSLRLSNLNIFLHFSVANAVDQNAVENNGTGQNYVSLTKQDAFFEDWRFTPNGPASAASTVEVEDSFMQSGNSNEFQGNFDHSRDFPIPGNEKNPGKPASLLNCNPDLDALDRCLEQHQLDYVGNGQGPNSDNELVHSISELKLPKQESAEAVVPTRDLDLDLDEVPPMPNNGTVSGKKLEF